MKSFKLIQLLFFLGFCFTTECNAKPSLVNYAIEAILTEYFAKESPKVDIINFGSKTG